MVSKAPLLSNLLGKGDYVEAAWGNVWSEWKRLRVQVCHGTGVQCAQSHRKRWVSRVEGKVSIYQRGWEHRMQGLMDSTGSADILEMVLLERLSQE